ncbi:MAG: alpha/beta hydrolase [Novosphingobium sp.]|nr:alpha/beta hydrolase [Novosphingobium sp.]MBO9601590.1 alpha/beta hydrolase [Novosphingobium sp.]
MASVTAASEEIPKGEHVLFAAGGPSGPARLSGIFYEPEAPGKTAVILIPQGSGALNEGDHDYNPLARKLMDAGYALLLANMRTANGAWFYTLFETSKDDIAAAIELMKSRGYTDMILLGTSLGGPRGAYYYAKTRDSSVKGFVFLASITSPYLERTVRRTPEQLAQFDRILDGARDLIAAGKEYEPVCFTMMMDKKEGFTMAGGEELPCDKPGQGVTLSAESFVNHFGKPEECNATSTKWTPEFDIPTAIVHSINDEVSYPPVAQAIYDSLENAPRRDMIWLEDPEVSHYLSKGLAANRYADEIVTWLLSAVPPKS